MNSKYTGKLVEHLLDKISSLSSGDVGDFIGTGLLDKFLRKDLDERTPHSLASDKKLEVGNFVSGTAGAVIYIDELTKHSVAEIDKLYVRLKAYFEQLEIINVNSVGGKLIISPAGGIKCSLVETYDSWGYYRCYFLSELDGEKIENRFTVGDLAYSKTFNAREGSYNKISNRYYWRLVVGVGENYIDLSKTDCDADSDEPQEGDVIVHRGNRNDVDRLNCLEFSSVDSFSPSITLYQGINDYSLANKNVIQFGVEKSTGKAFMNVYGDMFIGNRDNSSYIRYSPEKGVEIKGKLDIGTSFGDKTLLDAIDLASTAYEEDLNNLKDIVNRDILNILNLLDGAIETWFYAPIPTLTNLPASLWTTESDRNIHLGDLYYSGAGRAYRFQYDADNSLYYWQEIVDTDIVLALENAKKAQDTADSKRKIFVRKPEASDSYDIGDMWVNATYSDGNVTYTEDLLRAILSKEIGEQFSITHWTLASKYTDDTVANDALQKATEAQNSVNELLNSVGDFKGYVDGAFKDGIIDTSESQAIEKYINLLDTIKLQVDKSYEEIIKNSILENTLYLTNLNNSYTAFSSSYTELINTINSAISDSKTTDLEKAAVDGKYKTFNDKYRDYTAYLNLAINYIEETINGKVERALLDIGGYKYLKAALLENTSIEGGLIQSSMLSLGYTKNNLFLVMAGTNGLVLDKGDRTIASWFGGGMIDMFDYYDSNTKTFNVPEDVRAAAGLDRMDGTGYRAKGNLWWDEAGVVHADPLSFFVGEATVGGLLASFLVVMKEDGKHPLYLIPQIPFLSLEIADYIRIGDALLKYDSTNKAIYVTSVDGTTNMGFYASGYVSALGKNSSGGSTGSASALYQLADVAPNSTNDGVLNAANGSVLMYNGSKWQAGNVVTDISPLTLNVNGSSLFTYDGKSSITANLTVPTKVSQLTNDTGFITGISSSMVTGALGYTPYNSANPNGYISGITKAMVENVLTGNITSHTHTFASIISKPDTLAGYGISDGVSHKYLFYKADYEYYALLLCKVGSSTAYYAHDINGTLYTTFAGTNRYQAAYINIHCADWNGGHNESYNFTPFGMGRALRLVTCTYQSQTWLAVIYTNVQAHYAYFDGVVSEMSLTPVKYYNEYSGEVFNSEIYNSISDVSYNKLPFIASSNTVLDSGNYNYYSPSLTGAGASGTWGINISGNADTLDGFHYTSLVPKSVYSYTNGATVITSVKQASSKMLQFHITGNSYGAYGGLPIDTYVQCYAFSNNYFTNNPAMLNNGARIPYVTVFNYNGVVCLYIPSGGKYISLDVYCQDTMGGSGTNLVTSIVDKDLRSSGSYALQINPNNSAMTTGNVASATKLQTARTITLTGSVTGSVSFDGTSNVSIATSTNHTHSFESLTSKPTTIEGYGITDALTKKIFVYKNDYERYVILLCKIETNTTNTGSTINGVFYTNNSGGNRYNAAYVNIHCSNWSTGHNEYYGFTPFGMGTACRLVTCTYQSSTYLAVTFENIQACYIFFDGSYSNILFTPILYYTSNTGVINNSEIYNSIATVSYNKLAFTTDNVASATKLQTARTIWGQSFDGTANVSGDMTGVNNIYTSNTNFYIYNINKKQALIADSRYTILGFGTAGAGLPTYIDGSPIYMRCGTSYIEALTIINNGNVGIGTTSPSVKLHVIGDIAATGAVTAKASSSDIRLKTDISDYKALSIIRSHKSIKYHWNEVAKANADIFNDDYWHYGLIAQDVQRDMPQMVSDVFKDYLVINYERLIPICWKGLQEVDDEVTKLKKKVRKLEMEIRELKQKEDRL